MKYEVEVKYLLNDAERFEQTIRQLGAIYHSDAVQEDTYFGHPHRDFSATDEAFRMRQHDQQNIVTYKGPLIDEQTKTREEIEVQLEPGRHNRQKFQQILERLDFAPVFVVRKQRKCFHFTFESCPVEILIDNVTGLGTYVELEAQAEEVNFAETKDSVLKLAASLGLGPATERRSYLRLLIEKRRMTTHHF